jgi:hypothetical protein
MATVGTEVLRWGRSKKQQRRTLESQTWRENMMVRRAIVALGATDPTRN